MWICITHKSAAPISAKPAAGGTRPRRNSGAASKNPMKNATAAGSTYDGLMMWVENCSVHGIVNSQPQTSQRGTDGTRAQMYQACAASAIAESRFSRM